MGCAAKAQWARDLGGGFGNAEGEADATEKVDRPQTALPADAVGGVLGWAQRRSTHDVSNAERASIPRNGRNRLSLSWPEETGARGQEEMIVS